MKNFLLCSLLSFCVLAQAETAPTEFVMQILEPTGGKIERPKEWFYSEGHHGSSYIWTLSREDTSGNHSYETGVRIQVLSGVKQGTGKTPKQFVLDFIDGKSKSAKVVKSCSVSDQGLFTRICLETEEGRYHILYSLFWGNNMDMVVVSVAGTPKELWPVYTDTFDRMKEFEIIDMKRFEKGRASPNPESG